MSDIEEPYFLIHFNGQIQCAKFEGGNENDEFYLRYDIVSGSEWELIGGLDGGVSQTSKRGCLIDDIVFNMPVEVSYKTRSPFGWPQLILSVYGVNSWGVEAIRGYGRVHLPTTAGDRHDLVNLFTPRPTSMFADFMSWVTGRKPELINPKILADGKNNYLLTTRSYGCVDVKFTLISNGLRASGFDNVGASEMST